MLGIASTEEHSFTKQLFDWTSAGFPNTKLFHYPRMAYPAKGKQFASDLLTFLLEWKRTNRTSLEKPSMFILGSLAIYFARTER